MTERNRAAMYVYFRRIPAEPFVDRTRLRGEGFIRFNQIQIVRTPAGEFQGLL